jgi:hypothetical protein
MAMQNEEETQAAARHKHMRLLVAFPLWANQPNQAVLSWSLATCMHAVHDHMLCSQTNGMFQERRDEQRHYCLPAPAYSKICSVLLFLIPELVA